MRISHCTLKCKHGTYDSLLQHLCVFCTIPSSVPFISRYVTFSPFFYPPSFCPPHQPTQSSSVSFFWSLSHTFSVFAVLFEMFSSPAIFLCLPCSLSVHLSLAPLRAVSIFQTQRVFSRSCARVSGESGC